MKEIKTTHINQIKQPSNLEAEQALLGSILVNNDIIDEETTDRLSAESNAWDENSRAVIVATEFEAKLPVMLTQARQKFEHHMNYLNK